MGQATGGDHMHYSWCIRIMLDILVEIDNGKEQCVSIQKFTCIYNYVLHMSLVVRVGHTLTSIWNILE